MCSSDLFPSHDRGGGGDVGSQLSNIASLLEQLLSKESTVRAELSVDGRKLFQVMQQQKQLNDERQFRTNS